jgi:retron-type reverse transcriptase
MTPSSPTFQTKDSPGTVNDYMTISLLNSSLKLLTKLLAKRLQSVILSVVHTNQYGFIKGRTIQDCLASVFQFLHICHQSKREIIILKLDFEKAFDLVEHEAIISRFRHKGFSEKLVTWMKDILSKGSSQVLINEILGKVFKCKGGG